MTAHVIAGREEAAWQNDGSLAESLAPVGGVYHAGGSGETTWFGFAAQAIDDLRKLEPETKLASVEPIATSEYPTPAKRPVNSRLDCSKLDTVLGWRMPEWQDSLTQVMAAIRR
jgi:dTDP-4-dehydrorhamnose reductase